MDYYEQTFYIPQVNEQDEVLGKVERWKAHEKGILHRGFTVGITYDGLFICQHRKHPVFDGFLDLTASSHPLYIGNVPQTIEEAAFATLKREWSIEKKQIKNLRVVGKVLYNSKFQQYIEHEVCYLLIGEIDKIPQINMEVAYGFSLLTQEDLKSVKNPIQKNPRSLGTTIC